VTQQCAPASNGWGRKWCEQWCAEQCQAELNRTPDTCGERPIDVLPANRFAWGLFVTTFWQWRSSGMGDGVLDAGYVQQKLADKGVTGPERDDQMERLRVMCETFSKLLQKDQKKKKRRDGFDDAEADDE
jgi:hypothetical protein